VLEFPRRALLAGAAASIACACTPGTSRREAAVPRNTAAQPRPAAENGFDRLTFWDDFDSLDTIDIDNTGDPGFNWYVYRGKRPPIPKTDLRISDSVLTFTPTYDGYLVTAYKPLTPALPTVGRTFAGGGYFEARMSFAPKDPGLGKRWPAFWLFDILVSAAIRDGTPENFRGAEFDIMDLYIYGGPPLWGVHDWTVNTGGANLDIQNDNYKTSLTGIDYTKMNVWGGLWVPMARNKGRGLVRLFVNGEHIAENDVTYGATGPANPGASPQNPNGAFSILDRNQMVMLIGSGIGWPINVDYIMVWQ